MWHHVQQIVHANCFNIFTYSRNSKDFKEEQMLRVKMIFFSLCVIGIKEMEPYNFLHRDMYFSNFFYFLLRKKSSNELNEQIYLSSC